VGKITCACRHRRCGVGSSRWNINHAAVRPRVLSVSTNCQPPNAGHTCFIWGALCCSIQPQIIFHDHKRSNHFCTHHLFFVGFLVQLPSIISASGASCVPRTRVLGLESTDHAGPHCICALCVSAARQLTTAVPPSHIICAARTASSLRVDIRADSFCLPIGLFCPVLAAGVVTAPQPSLFSVFVHNVSFLRRGQFHLPLALLCRFYVDFQPAPELAMHRPTIVGPAGTEGNHFSAFCGRPSFSLQPSLPHDVSCISHAPTALRWSHWTLSTC